MAMLNNQMVNPVLNHGGITKHGDVVLNLHPFASFDYCILLGGYPANTINEVSIFHLDTCSCKDAWIARVILDHNFASNDC